VILIDEKNDEPNKNSSQKSQFRRSEKQLQLSQFKYLTLEPTFCIPTLERGNDKNYGCPN